jgi:hypothetical protein
VVTFKEFSIIVAYGPTECGYSWEEKSSFYELLDKATRLCNKHFPVYLIGDFNARVGSGPSNIIGNHYVTREDHANENGLLLKSLAARHNMRLEHTFYNSKQSKKSTWRRGKGRSVNMYATLDHILTLKRFKYDYVSCKTYGKFTKLSDHRMLILKVKRRRISFKKAPRPFVPPAYWFADRIKGVSNHFMEHSSDIVFDENDIDGSWFRLSQILQEGIQVTPKFPEDDTIFIHGENSDYFTLDKWWEEKAKVIESEIKKHNLRKMFQYINGSYIKKTKTPANLCDIVKKVKLPDIDYPYFTLYSVANRVVEMDTMPTLQDMQDIINKMSNGKACGLDGIPLEVYKDDEVAKRLYDFLIIVWKKRKIPEEWRKALLVPIPKSIPGDYRGINLLCSAYKIYAKLILFKILDWIMEFLGPNQNGFLPGRSTSDVIGCMRRLVSASVRYGSTLHAMLVDFSKAFDRISRNALKSILIDIGFDFNMVERIMDLLTHTIAVVRSESEEDMWEVFEGVRQGCPIGPILFLVVLGFLMKSIRLRFTTVKDQEYADDLTLIDSSMDRLEEILKVIVEEEGPPLGLIVNEKKTDFIHVTSGKVEKSTKLLGTWIGESWEKTITRNIDKARNSFLMLYKNLWLTTVSSRVKMMVFSAVCISILLYGLESIPLTATRLKKLDSFAYLSIRSILGYKFFHHKSYEDLFQECKEFGFKLNWPSAILMKKRRTDYWHFFRHHNDFALLGVTNERVRNRSWTLDHIMCREEGIKLKDLHILAKDPEATRGVDDMKKLIKDTKLKAEVQKQEEYAKNKIIVAEIQKSLRVRKESLASDVVKESACLLGLVDEWKQESTIVSNSICY